MQTRLTELVGVQRPIVQTGMGWVAYPSLVGAVSQAGGLGILAAATMDIAELATAIAEVKALTDKPFGVNLVAASPDARERIDLMAAQGVRVASFAQAPKVDLVQRAKEAGMVVMPSIGAKRHAEKVAAWGADAVIVQGGEGGGHTGSVPTSLLLPQVVDAVAEQVVVVAAGGYFDGRGLVSALAYGASGIAMGTRFLLTRETPVAPGVKDVYLTKSVTDTVVTVEVDGVPHRVLRTPFVEALEGRHGPTRLLGAVRHALAFSKLSGRSLRSMAREGLAMHKAQELTWSQVMMAANAPMLLKRAMVDGETDLGVMAGGQVVGVIDDVPTVSDLLDRIEAQAEDVLARLLRPPSDGP